MSDPRRPDFKVSVDGNPIANDVIARVIQITVDDSLDQAAVATIRLRCDALDPNGEKDVGPFKIGSELKVDLGYVAATEQVFVGEITGLKGSFPRRANPTLTVIAMDKFHRLRRNTRQKTYLEQKDSEAIQAAAQAAGLSVGTVDATEIKQSNIQQWDQTDADFILQRARACGLEVLIDDKGKLTARKPKLDDAAAATITWHQELQHFAVGISLANQQTELVTSAWDMSKKARVEQSVKKGDEPSTMGGTKTGADMVASLEQPPTVFPDVPCSSQEEVKALAQSLFTQRSQDFVTGEGSCDGDPKIRRGTVVDVQGIGSFLEGPYYVTQAIHTLLMGSGYTTTFRVKRTALDAPAPEPANTAEVQTEPGEPYEVKPEPEPLSFKVQDPKGQPSSGVPFVLRSPDGTQKTGDLSSDGKVEIDFQDE